MGNLKEQLRKLEEYHMKPEVRKNSKELLSSVLADEFFEIGSSGKFYYRDDCMVDSGIGEWDTVMSDFEVHPLADGVVLTTYRVEDKTRQRNTLRSSIWKQIGGHWRLYYHQGTIEDSTEKSQ